jgi:bacillithiol biosynthesis cysteine-adding enzyme BshC
MMDSPSFRSLPFHRLPHQPGVFLKYVDSSADVLPFFRHPPTLEGIHLAVDDARLRPFPRRELAEILRSQNQRFGGGHPVRQAIEELEKPDSVAILTGQQVGLFAGPLLTIYKALTALRLSDDLRRDGINAVPIFWLASDDHDLAEIARMAAPGPGFETRMLDVREFLFGTTAVPPHPVGTIRLPGTIRQLVQTYCGSQPESAWGREFLAQLAECYAPGTTFAEAFGRLMALIFQGRGLILFDPRDSGAKRLSAPVLGSALQEATGLRAQLADRSRALQQSGMAAQVAVLPHSTLVFLEDEGGRRLLVTKELGFTLRDTGRMFFLDELLELTRSAPERFSPNVLLRPVVQDHLFPTVAYVGGPAEVSYFAQIEPLYQFYGRPMPVIWPRSSYTILDAGICATLDNLGLQLEDCFHGERHLLHTILKNRPAPFSDVLNGLGSYLDGSIARVTPNLVSTEPTLGPAADMVRRKLLHRIGSLQTKFLHFELRRDSALRQTVSQLLANCYPNGSLQERVLGAVPLLARFGPSMLDTLYEGIDTRSFGHRIVCP